MLVLGCFVCFDVLDELLWGACFLCVCGHVFECEGVLLYFFFAYDGDPGYVFFVGVVECFL